MKRLKVLAWPAHSNKDSNPYNHLLYTAIEGKGAEVKELYFGREQVFSALFKNDFDIIHIHWPSNVLITDTYFSALKGVILFWIFFVVAKTRGKKVVWTVHNIQTHESRYPFLQKLLDKILYKYIDGFISLNSAGVDAIKNKLRGKNQRCCYIPHLHYRGYYENAVSKKQARKILNIGEGKFVFLFIGQIRAYKNLPALIKAFCALETENKILVIAGNMQQAIAKEIKSAVSAHNNILLHDHFIENKDLQLYLNCADMVVTPYNDIFNSGSVFLNLSFYRPTLGPALGALPEIQSQVGNEWILTYSGLLTAQHLEYAMTKVNVQSYTKPDLMMFDPEVVAEQTLNFYHSL